MDFKFRPMEDRSSTYHPPSPPNFSSSSTTSFSYFTEQAIRAGLASPESRLCKFPPRNPNPNFAQESLHRELEKERIRAEIIAEEIARRRVLLEAARREKMLEREFAVRRGFEPRSPPLLTDSETRDRMFGVGDSNHWEEVWFRPDFETPSFQRDPGVLRMGNSGRWRERA